MRRVDGISGSDSEQGDRSTGSSSRVDSWVRDVWRRVAFKIENQTVLEVWSQTFLPNQYPFTDEMNS